MSFSSFSTKAYVIASHGSGSDVGKQRTFYGKVRTLSQNYHQKKILYLEFCKYRIVG